MVLSHAVQQCPSLLLAAGVGHVPARPRRRLQRFLQIGNGLALSVSINQIIGIEIVGIDPIGVQRQRLQQQGFGFLVVSESNGPAGHLVVQDA
ncbi:hypothetical protein G6F22_021752 [Rhizopus arrhizus]|nr:hypothetical protein G6F22_021752 [Rhizopus arrhizus]KAG0920880.1 hypothetical protein G6F31_020541 [Rhizopus arrhizus]